MACRLRQPKPCSTTTTPSYLRLDQHPDGDRWKSIGRWLGPSCCLYAITHGLRGDDDALGRIISALARRRARKESAYRRRRSLKRLDTCTTRGIWSRLRDCLSDAIETSDASEVLNWSRRRQRGCAVYRACQEATRSASTPMWCAWFKSPGQVHERLPDTHQRRRCANIVESQEWSITTIHCFEQIGNMDHHVQRRSVENKWVERVASLHPLSISNSRPEPGALPCVELVALRRAGEDQLGGSRDGERRGVGAAKRLIDWRCAPSSWNI